MDKIFRQAAKSALFSWKQSDEGIDDLVNELWVWYLERPGTQKKLQESDEFLARRLVYMASLQILAKESLSNDMFNGRSLYSSDSVREALEGKSTNRYLVDILPRAMEALGAQNDGRYAEAIRSRYDDGVIPVKKGGGAMTLARAVKSLTEHVNIIAITAGVDSEGNVTEGPGSRHSVFPETRPTSGGHSDPTADIAILLIEHPEVRDEYLHETPIADLLKGRAA
ncbi:DNA binding protein [Mycobacterium phage DarthPhader]|uniref:DNA binding protein n=1 Tax=Mycobacterium phage DarthPhader TaxID=1912975 RepID=A0A1I9S3Z6_9CAUD|nr:sigma-K factor [Mycobacterium phage DarthPhader]AOZ61290.1 DNA binding protein [Mycobacterium phage DarthPhader]